MRTDGPLALTIHWDDSWDIDAAMAILANADPAEQVCWICSNCELRTTASTMLAWLELSRLSC